MRLCHGSPFVRRGVLAAALLVASQAAPVQGQQTAGAPASKADANPITCWWRTGKDAVRVGELFTLALTCNVADTEALRVVVDPARLDPAVLQMMPFEVMSGSRHEDIATPPSRSFQYSYTLRILGDEFFGKDVDIPATPLTYRVQQSGETVTQGRDQVYLLPALPMRVLSLVPGTATDIHDAPGELFADIESRSVRATAELAIAAVLFGCAVLLAGAALVRALRRGPAGETAAAPLLPAHALVRACEREAQRVKADAAAGWTADLIGRALTVFRIAGAAALDRPIVQAVVKTSQTPGEGQLVIETGPPWKRRHVLLSGSTTAATIARQVGAEGGDGDPQFRETLEDLAAPLQLLIGAHYGRGGQLETGALDTAVDRGIRGLQRLQSTTRWPGRAAGPLARAAAMLRETIWAR